MISKWWRMFWFLILFRDEPMKNGEISVYFMRRVQARACDVSLLLGWLPGMKDMVFDFTSRQKQLFDASDKVNHYFDARNF